MSNAGSKLAALIEPISADRPCGENLDGQPPLTTLDALRLFGLDRSPDTPLDKHEAEYQTRKLPDWGEVRSLALEGLNKSRDLRLLAYLGTAVLRTDGLAAFFETLSVASHWLDASWKEVYPVVDEDAIERRNALNCLADKMAVLDRLRRAVVVESRKHGRFSLRDIDIAKGNLQPGPSDGRPEMAQIDAAFSEMPTETLAALQQGAEAALAAVNRIDAKMRDEGGPEVAPGFEPLSALLARLQLLLQGHLIARTGHAGADADGAATAGVAGETGGGSAPGVIATREDALRALDAVADFFRRSEPSSPVPLLVDRAKRLVSKSFLEVLADMAPDAVGGVRAVGGLKDSE
jgi:type VI secretion system protein ImpA